VHRAQRGGYQAHRAEAIEDEREDEPGSAAERNTEHGEGHRPDDTADLDGCEGRRQDAADEASELGAGMERADAEVGKRDRGECHEQKDQGRRAVGQSRQNAGSLHCNSPSK